MGFQQSVKAGLAIGLPGQQCTDNPIAVLAKMAEEAILAASFVWLGSSAAQVVNHGTGKPYGFVLTDHTADITTHRAGSTLTYRENLQVQCAYKGEFYVAGEGASEFRDKVFASYIDGTVTFDAAGTDIETAEFTAAISANTTLTVSAVASGEIKVGQRLYGSNIADETYIADQVSGTPGGVGVYTLAANHANVSSATMRTTDYVETDFSVIEGGADGATVKMSTWI